MLVRVVIALVGFLALSACSPQEPQDEGPRFVQVEVGALTSDRYNTGGVSWADANGDGILDAVVANGYNVAAGEPYEAQENRIYLGTAAGGFEVAETNGLTDAPQFSSGTAWADVDGDGLADVLIANQRDQDNALYLARRGEDGTLSYEHTPAGELSSDGGWSYAAGFADVDSDGLLDAFVSEGGLSHEGPNRLYRNLGGGRFERVTDTELSRLSQGTGAAVWADYDNDGDSDLFTASRTAGDGIPLALYRNDGNLLFTRMEGIGLVSDFRPVITAAWADVDNDLNLDLYVGGMSGFSGGLYINNGDGTFRLRGDDPLSTTAGNAYAATFGDYDNDGDQDLMVAHWGGGTMLFQNDGTGRFDYGSAELLPPHVEWAAAIAHADYDNDGDLDVLIGNWPYGTGEDQENTLLRNDLGPSNWVRFHLVGAAPNTSAIGARVYLTVGGVTQMREIQTQTSWRSQNALAAHFGLGREREIGEVLVRWPGGSWEAWRDITPQAEHPLVEGTGVPTAGR